MGETSERIYFIVINAINELNLWFSDGTTAGMQVRSMDNTGNDVNVNFARIAGDTIVFNADITRSTQSLQVALLTGGNAVELLEAHLEHIVGNGPYLISAGIICRLHARHRQYSRPGWSTRLFLQPRCRR